MKQLTYQVNPDFTHVGVCGTRDFNDWELFQERMLHFCYWLDDDIVVVHGGQKETIGWMKYAGADYLAQRWACKNWYSQIVFHAEWSKYKKAAGPIRNREMAEHLKEQGGVLIAFWDGDSTGTFDMIQQAKRLKLDHRIVYYA